MPVTALDAAAGENVLTYTGTEGAHKILYYDDMLLLVLGEPQKDWEAERAKEIVSKEGCSPPFEHYLPPIRKKRVVAVDAKTGNQTWMDSEPYARELVPPYPQPIFVRRFFLFNTCTVIFWVL